MNTTLSFDSYLASIHKKIFDSLPHILHLCIKSTHNTNTQTNFVWPIKIHLPSPGDGSQLL